MEASRKVIPAEHFDGWKQGVRAIYDQMPLITATARAPVVEGACRPALLCVQPRLANARRSQSLLRRGEQARGPHQRASVVGGRTAE
jgi:hypothetical protein